MFLPPQIARLQKMAPRSPSPALPGAWPLHTTPDNDHTRNVIFERLSQSQPSEPLAAGSGLHHALDELPVCDTGTSTTRTDPVLIAPFPHLPHVATPRETAYMALSASGSTDFSEKLTGADIDALVHLTYPQPALDSELGLASKFYQREASHANSVINSDSCGLLGVTSELPVQITSLTEASPPLICTEQPNPVPFPPSLETAIQLTPSIQMLARRSQAFLLEFPGSQNPCENSQIENQDNQHHDSGSVSPSSMATPHDHLLPVSNVTSTDVDLLGYPSLLSSNTGTESTREVNGGLDLDFLSLLSQPDGDEAWTLLLGSASECLSFSSTASPNSVSLPPPSSLRPSEEVEQHVGFSSSSSSPDARGVEALPESDEDGETEATQYAAALLETALATVNTITGPSSSEDDALAIGVRIPDANGQQEESRSRDKNASSHSNVVVRRVKRLGGKVKRFFSKKQTKGSGDQREGQRPGPSIASSLVFSQDEIVDMEGTPYEDQQGGSPPLRLATSVSSPIFTSTLPPRIPIYTSRVPEILSPPSGHQSSAAYQNTIAASQSSPLDGTVGSMNQHSLHSYGIFSRPKTLAEIKSKRRFSLPTFNSSFPSSTSPPLGTSVVAASTPLTKPQSTMTCMGNGSAPGGPSASEVQRPRSVIEPVIAVSSRRLSQPVKKKIWQSLPRISALRKS